MCQNSLFNVIALATDSCNEGYSSFIKICTLIQPIADISNLFQDLIDNVVCKVVVYLIFKAKPPPGAK
jgi:hypothetical protein